MIARVYTFFSLLSLLFTCYLVEVLDKCELLVFFNMREPCEAKRKYAAIHLFICLCRCHILHMQTLTVAGMMLI